MTTTRTTTTTTVTLTNTGRLRTIIRNTGALLASEMISKVATLALYAIIARKLGAHEFGQLSLGLTLMYAFQMLAGAGLKTLITREVAKDRALTNRYLANGSIAVSLFSLLSMAMVLSMVLVLNYSASTSAVLLLLSLSLLPISLSAVFEAIFQAWERMDYITLANAPMNVLRIALIWLALSSGYGMGAVIAILITSTVAVAVFEAGLMRYAWRITRLRATLASIDLRFAVKMTKAGSAFLGIEFVIAVNTSISFLILSKLTSEETLGFYNAGTQLMSLVVLISQNVVLAVFPLLCQKFDADSIRIDTRQSGREAYPPKLATERLIQVLLAAVLPMTVGLFFFADLAFGTVHGRAEFTAGSPALRIMVWTLIATALNSVFGRVLMASTRERVVLFIVIVDGVVGFLFSLILISQFGLIGAAMAALIVKMIELVLHYVPVSRLLGGFSLARLGWQPFLATLCMAVYLVVIGHYDSFINLILAGMVYVIALLTLLIASNGGVRQFKANVSVLLGKSDWQPQ